MSPSGSEDVTEIVDDAPVKILLGVAVGPDEMVGFFVTLTLTVLLALPPCPSVTTTVIVYVPDVDGAVYVTDEPVPEIVPPVADHA